MADNRERVTALEHLIQKYQTSYYNGEGEISDAEFDILWDELKSIDPSNALLKRVGQDTSDGFPKANHLIPMGSQEKAANTEDFRRWAEKMQKRGDFGGFIVQYKLDGASLELQYQNGKLVKAVTRGDGVTGDDISANARKMNGVAGELKTDFSGGVRGEVVMTHEVWQKKYRDKANCRNAANGLMRRKDGQGSEDLSLITYDAGAAGGDAYFKSEVEKITWLTDNGFLAAEAAEFSGENAVEEIIAYRESVAAKRSNLSVDIDGLVIKDKNTDVSDLRRARPERQIAFKFDLETAFSILRSVEWSESGATYTPIGVIDPVHLAGTTVKRANLNNPDMIRAINLKIGSAVSVVKRGEIIPKIEGLAPPGALPEGELREIEQPVQCSSCGTALKDEGTRLFCPNAACPKRLHHRLEKWVSVLDIRELGEKLIALLFKSGKAVQIADLYALGEDDISGFERMGALSAAKVIRHIKTPRVLSLAAFVAGFDFEGVGETIMERVVNAGFDTLEKLRNADADKLESIYGMGAITAAAIMEGLAASREEMDRVLASGIISIAAPPQEQLPLHGKSFCFTGELKTMKRAAAEEKVKALGGSSKSSVVRDLSYLVTNDTESGSAKNKKAGDLGVKIINEEQFLSLVGDLIIPFR
jgi:DNA ligase (NAD+)